MNQRICDHCGKVALPGFGAGWFHVDASAHYVIGREPRELDFCGWECMVDYAVEQNTAHSPPGSPRALLDVVDAGLAVPWDRVGDTAQDRVTDDDQERRVRETEARISRLRAALAPFSTGAENEGGTYG